MSHGNRASSIVDDYMSMRTLPAALSVAFVMASLYQFHGITQISLEWLSYTLTTEHAVLVSLGAFAAAFASSETRQFENYDDWEKAAIAAGPAVIIGHQYIQEVNDFLLSLGDPLGLQVAFAATLLSWGVAVQ